MKILYISHYREGGGWSQASINYMQALSSIGIDVVCRNVSLTNKYIDVPVAIEEMEQKSLDGVDYCIQHVLPHHLVSTDKFKKNVAYCVFESVNLSRNQWIPYLKNMDEVWVPCEDNKTELEKHNIKVSVVPHTFDIEKYENRECKKLTIPDVEGKFKFYYIGDFNSRKNLAGLIRAFHSEFVNQEPVALIVKINKFGVSPQDLNKMYVNFSNEIKKSMRMYKSIHNFCSEVVITKHIEEEDITTLHKNCDCFVTISHGEAWSIPSFEAMAFGNTPICSNEGGPKDFIDKDDKNTGSLINGVYNVCNCSDPAFEHIFTGREEWFEPSESETKRQMRYFYENRDKINRASGLERAKQYSYTNIANKIKEYLSE